MRIAAQKIQTFYSILWLIFSSLFIYLALKCYYADSEIWLLTISQKTLAPGTLHSIYYKWFFHVVVYASTFWTQNNLLIYDSVRFVFALIALSSLMFLTAVFSKFYQKKHLFFPAALFCLTSSLFFNQGFRIRADILALFFHAFFLFSIFNINNSQWTKTLPLSAIQILMLLTTPKALIFINLHILTGIYLFAHDNKDKRMLGQKILLSIFLPFSIGLLGILILAISFPGHSILHAIHAAIDFYLKSFDPELGGASFFKHMDFMYIIRFLQTSYAHTLFFICWLILFLHHILLKNKKPDHTYLHIYSAVLLIQILLYNQKLPFFLGAFLTPLMAISYYSVDSFLSQNRFFKWLTSALLIFSCWLCSKQFLLNVRFNNNSAQKEFISELSTYHDKNPQFSIYDIIGLLPRSNTIFQFIGPGEVSRSEEILSNLEAQKPDIYLMTYKNIFFGSKLTTFLKQNYFESSPGVWLRSINIHTGLHISPSTGLINYKGKKYWLFPIEKPTLAYSHSFNKDILSEILILDKDLNPAQYDSSWAAIPIEHIHFSLVTLPPPALSQNPFNLFRFDTGF